MNSKERVHAALERKHVDRVPIFMWFHPSTAERLARLLEIPVTRLGEAMGNDIQQTWVNNNYAMEGITHTKDGEGHVDFWGIQWVKQYSFNQIESFPLAAASPEEIYNYRFPYEHLEELLHQMDPLLEDNQNYADIKHRAGREHRFIGCDVSPCAFEMYWRLRGMGNAMLDIAANPNLARTMLARCADFAVALSIQACERFPLDWLWTGDDVASQLKMMISPRTWREMIKPELKRVFTVGKGGKRLPEGQIGKSHNLWVAYHCCGALRPIIPDLIEIGMDVLNPVQGNCPGMDPFELKREFGDQIAFMGGLDTQDLLPHGSVVDVRRMTARLLEGMTAGGGGYILAASHTIPPETPDQNIFAMYAEAGITEAEIFDRAADIRSDLSP